MNVFLPHGKIKETLAKLLLMLICVLGITMLTYVYAKEPSKQATATNTAVDDLATDKKKLKCRRIKIVGTNIAKKVCDTKENWKTLDNRNRAGVDEYTRRTQEGANIINESSSVDQSGGMSTGVLGGP